MGKIQVNKNSKTGFYKIGYHESGIKTIDLTIPYEISPSITDIISEIMRFMQFVKSDDYSFSAEYKRVTGLNIPVINLIPDQPTANLPLIFLVHGFETSKEKVIRYGIHFASHGFYTVMMDLPDHGERMIPGFFEKYLDFENSPEIWINRLSLMKKSVEELRLIVDHYHSLTEIDSSRIGMTGISMGGTIVLLESYSDPRIKAISPLLSIVGFDQSQEKYLSGKDKQLVKSLDPLFVYDKKPDAAVLLQFGEKDKITEKPSLSEFDKNMKSFFKEEPERYGLIKHKDMGHDVNSDMINNAVMWFEKFLKSN
jgi:dienelactone hydrolase